MLLIIPSSSFASVCSDVLSENSSFITPKLIADSVKISSSQPTEAFVKNPFRDLTIIKSEKIITKKDAFILSGSDYVISQLSGLNKLFYVPAGPSKGLYELSTSADVRLKEANETYSDEDIDIQTQNTYEVKKVETYKFGTGLVYYQQGSNSFVINTASKQVIHMFSKMNYEMTDKINRKTGEFLAMKNYSYDSALTTLGLITYTVNHTYLYAAKNNGHGDVLYVNLNEKTILSPKKGFLKKKKPLSDLLKDNMEIVFFDFKTGLFHINQGRKRLVIDTVELTYWYE